MQNTNDIYEAKVELRNNNTRYYRITALRRLASMLWGPLSCEQSQLNKMLTLSKPTLRTYSQVWRSFERARKFDIKSTPPVTARNSCFVTRKSVFGRDTAELRTEKII